MAKFVFRGLGAALRRDLVRGGESERQRWSRRMYCICFFPMATGRKIVRLGWACMCVCVCCTKVWLQYSGAQRPRG